MHPITHPNTWNGVAGTSAFFSVSGAAVGNQFQENAGAIISVVSCVVIALLQFRAKIMEDRRTQKILDAETERKIAQLDAEAAQARAAERAANIVTSTAETVAAELIQTTADDATRTANKS